MTGLIQQGFTTRALRHPWAAVLLVGCLLWPHMAASYGSAGHLVAGHVAERFICAETRGQLQELMVDYSLAEAGLWADQIRSDPARDYARPWHYINIPDGEMLSAAARRSDGDVLSAIQRFRSELADPALPVGKRLEAFYFLTHFIADVHQPLHAGDRADLGGNTVDVNIVDADISGQQSNLHRYWDSLVLKPVSRNPASFADSLAERYRPFADRWQQAEPAVWAIESQAFRPEVYSFVQPLPGQPAVLDVAYQQRALQITQLRLAQAGIRLAGELNAIWCPHFNK